MVSKFCVAVFCVLVGRTKYCLSCGAVPSRLIIVIIIIIISHYHLHAVYLHLHS
jgi:hypothetical protein